MPIEEVWQKHQTEEAHHQGERRLQLKMDDFENFFKVSREIFKDQSCLEVGCGVTGIIHYIDNAKYRVGLDPLCTICADLYKREGTDNIPHITGVGEDLPFENDSFDTVFIYGVLDHCLKPEVVLEETLRVLKESGRVYILVFTFPRIPKFIRNKLNLVDLHPYHLSTQEVVNISLEVGFKIDKLISYKVSFKQAWITFKTGTLKSALKYVGATILGIEEVALILVKE